MIRPTVLEKKLVCFRIGPNFSVRRQRGIFFVNNRYLPAAELIIKMRFSRLRFLGR